MELLQRSIRAARWAHKPITSEPKYTPPPAPQPEAKPLADMKPAELARVVDPFIPTVPFPRILEIQKLTAKHFNRSVTDLISARRTADLVVARHVAIYLAKTLTPHSLPEIGRRFGKRDHTSILFAVRKITRLRAEGHPIVCDAVARICTPFGGVPEV